MNIKLTKSILAATLLAASGMLPSCVDEGDGTFVVTPGNDSDIPSDSKATPNPGVTAENAYIPNVQYTTVDENGTAVIRLDMTGVQDPNTGDWLRLEGTGSDNQNVWVEVDGKPKGITVYNTVDGNHERTPLIDLVFLVDNSGSMSEEADVIARDIIAWSEQLVASGIDIRFGSVGYDGSITGAIDLTDATELSEYLNRYTGTSRTMGFGGSNALLLSELASHYFVNSSVDECGVAALRMADENFTFRREANRIYVNFTDEPNYPCGNSQYSVESVRDQSKWSTSNGTIHTVYSGYKGSMNEEPWLLSTYTGGTVIFTDGAFTGVSLSTLPVSDAMQNSYVIRFTNISDLMDGQPHTIHITIYSKDGTVQAERTFVVIFKPAE